MAITRDSRTGQLRDAYGNAVTIAVNEDGTAVGAGASVIADTELPAAAALADATATPTTPLVGAANEVFNGTTWDRARGVAAADTLTSFAGTGIPKTAIALFSSGGSLYPLGNGAGLSDATGGWFNLPTVGWGYNGATFDRLRTNTEGTLLASAARTGTTSSADQVNYNARGVLVFFSVTVAPGGDTVTLTVAAKDPIAGTYETLLTGAAEAATMAKCYLIYPGSGAAANGVDVVGAFPLPRTWRVTVTHSAGTSFTYSVGYALIV